MTSQPTDQARVTTASAEFTWEPHSRIAVIRYAQGASLIAKDGDDLDRVFTAWIGSNDEPFGVVAEATGLRGTDGPYRARAGDFFRRHRHTTFIALIKPGPVIQIVAEMFRIGTGVQLKAFATEDEGRTWLRTKGIAT